MVIKVTEITNFIIIFSFLLIIIKASDHVNNTKFRNNVNMISTRRKVDDFAVTNKFLEDHVLLPVFKVVLDVFKNQRPKYKSKSKPKNDGHHDHIHESPLPKLNDIEVFEPNHQIANKIGSIGSCDGLYQSPIDINLNSIKENISLYIKLTSYHEPIKGVYLENNGKNVHMSMPSNVSPILGGPAVNNQDYLLYSVHFHWGNEDLYGSEHSIDGQKFAMEAHFVHFNKKYRNIQESLHHPDGLAVLATFFKVTPENNWRLDPFISAIRNVENIGDKAPLHGPLDLLDFFPNDIKLFFRYHGSLTTPPCDEVVTWIIFPKPLQIGKQQLKVFRHLNGFGSLSAEKSLMLNNWRGLQKLNHRIIECSYSPKFKIND